MGTSLRQAGDRVHFQLIDPNGQVVVDNHQTLAEPNRTWMGYVGKRSPERPIIPGVWRGEYQLQRGDRSMSAIANHQYNLVIGCSLWESSLVVSC